MGDMKVDRPTINTSFVWFIKDFVNYTLGDEILVATDIIKIKERQQHWSMKLRKDKSYLKYKIEISSNPSRNTDEGKVTLAILTPSLDKANEYSVVVDVHHESEITFLLGDLTENNSVLFRGRHLLLSGTISFTTPDKNYSFSTSKETPGLRQTLSALLKSGAFHDFTIEVKNKNFFCHKPILASRSKYFRLLFKEKKDIRNMRLLNTEPNVFEKILKYIYTGEVNIAADDVLQLIDASKMFSITRLSDICEEKLLSYFSLQNVFEMLDVSSSCELKNLRELAFRLITMFAEDNQMSSKDASQNSVSNLEANKDQIERDHSEANLSQKEATVLQSLELTEYPSTSLGGKPYLPPADVWYAEESRVIFRESWEFNIYEKNEKTKHFKDDESNCTFELSHTLNEIKMNKMQNPIRQKNVFSTLNLRIKSKSSKLVRVRCYISFANKDQQAESVVFENSHYFELRPYGYEKTDSINSVRLDSLPISYDGTVSMRCIILYKESFSCEFKQSSCDSDDWIRDISSLDQDEDLESLKDLEIRFCKGEKFSCHKAIVLSLCPFLKEKMKENQEKGVIILDDIDVPHFRTFLSFLYGNAINQSVDSLAWELLPSAHVFQMNDLREACEEKLVSQLNLENALKFHEFSKKYDLPKLEESSIKFISNYYRNIMTENRSRELFKDSRLLRAVMKQQ